MIYFYYQDPSQYSLTARPGDLESPEPVHDFLVALLPAHPPHCAAVHQHLLAATSHVVLAE